MQAHHVGRVVAIAKLRSGSHEAAAELLRAGPPFDPGAIGLVRHDAYLSASEVVFVFEGPDVELRLGGLLDDPAASASFGVWGPLLEATPTAAHELYHWEAAGDDDGAGGQHAPADAAHTAAHVAGGREKSLPAHDDAARRRP